VKDTQIVVLEAVSWHGSKRRWLQIRCAYEC